MAQNLTEKRIVWPLSIITGHTNQTQKESEKWVGN